MADNRFMKPSSTPATRPDARLRSRRVRRGVMPVWTALGLMLCVAVGPVLAQEAAGAGPAVRKSLLQFIHAGGWVAYTLLLLSVAAVALTVNAFLRVQPAKLLPDDLARQAEELAAAGKFQELRDACGSDPSMLGRTLSAGLEDGTLGIDAVREAMQRQGQREMTRLHQSVGYLSLIGSVAPILGLLGTVLGMISSFDVLGSAGNAADPEELAGGISEALITTCLGLILAIPALFAFVFLRDRVTRVGQELAAQCEKSVRLMSTVLDMRARGLQGPAPKAAPIGNPQARPGAAAAAAGPSGSAAVPGPVPTYTPPAAG